MEEVESEPVAAAPSTSEPFTIPLEEAEAASNRYEELQRTGNAPPEEIEQAERDWEAEREEIMQRMTEGGTGGDR